MSEEEQRQIRGGEARRASTVILLRDGEDGLELFMMERHVKSDFVGGAYVFPGGTVDRADAVDDSLCVGTSDISASSALKLEEGGLMYWIAAMRECFEDAGVLLMYDSMRKMLDFREPSEKAKYFAYRRKLLEGELTISDLARSEGLRFATDRIHYWGHWITPEGQRRRYDTRFFLAVAPEDQTAWHDGRELTNSCWVTPNNALAKAEAGEWTIIFPTLRNVLMLRDFRTTEEAEAAAKSKRNIEAIQPRIVKDVKGVRILVPGDPGFDEAGRAPLLSENELADGSLSSVDVKNSQ